MRYVIGPAAEFPDGERRIVKLGARSVGVFRVGERFFAVKNRCPHQGGPLCLGDVMPRISSSAPGAVQTEPRPPLISCPWHGWEYDLATGESFIGASEPGVKGYSVSVQAVAASDDVAVAQAETLEGLGQRGPFTANTYEVTVDERDLVVVEI